MTKVFKGKLELLGRKVISDQSDLKDYKVTKVFRVKLDLQELLDHKVISDQ